jgi:hypothetical protein
MGGGLNLVYINPKFWGSKFYSNFGSHVCYVFFKLDGLTVNFCMKQYSGFRYFFLAKLLVTIPSYMFILDGYNQGVGEGSLQK